MAESASPLFVPTIEELKRSLRLGKLIDADSAAPIFYDCILRARMQMLKAIDSAMLARLNAVAYTTSPTSRAEVARVEAHQLEVVLVKYHLFSELPVQSLDRSGDIPDHYNKEAPTRLLDFEERGEELDRLRRSAEELMGSICEWYSSTCVAKLPNAAVSAIWIGPEEEPADVGIFFDPAKPFPVQYRR